MNDLTLNWHQNEDHELIATCAAFPDTALFLISRGDWLDAESPFYLMGVSIPDASESCGLYYLTAEEACIAAQASWDSFTQIIAEIRVSDPFWRPRC